MKKTGDYNYIILVCSVITLGFFLLLQVPVYGESLYSKMNQGNNLYQHKQFDQALKSFVDAQIESPEDPRLKYNVANTHYQMRNYEEAIKNYQDVAATAQDIHLEEQSLYNIGNCMYRQGKLEEAMEYYKKALELDPNDQDAKYNLEFVREEIKKRLNQAKQREQEQQKQENKPQEGKEEQKQQEPGEQKEQGQKPQPPEEEQKQQAQAAPQQPPSQADEQKGGNEERAQAKPMTPEEAESWLRSTQEGKRDYKKREKEQRGGSYRPEKDW